MQNILLNGLTTGTVIRVWHSTRGHDYVYVGRDTETNQALFLKANTINSNGTVHAATNKFHIVRDIVQFGDDSTVSRVSTIIGQKPLDKNAIIDFATQRVGLTTFEFAKRKSVIKCSPRRDNRSSFIYE